MLDLLTRQFQRRQGGVGQLDLAVDDIHIHRAPLFDGPPRLHGVYAGFGAQLQRHLQIARGAAIGQARAGVANRPIKKGAHAAALRGEPIFHRAGPVARNLVVLTGGGGVGAVKDDIADYTLLASKADHRHGRVVIPPRALPQADLAVAVYAAAVDTHVALGGADAHTHILQGGYGLLRGGEGLWLKYVGVIPRVKGGPAMHHGGFRAGMRVCGACDDVAKGHAGGVGNHPADMIGLVVIKDGNAGADQYGAHRAIFECKGAYSKLVVDAGTRACGRVPHKQSAHRGRYNPLGGAGLKLHGHSTIPFLVPLCGKRAYM